jgi:hypothetical protein
MKKTIPLPLLQLFSGAGYHISLRTFGAKFHQTVTHSLVPYFRRLGTETRSFKGQAIS